jgi:hypothetical protein
MTHRVTSSQMHLQCIRLKRSIDPRAVTSSIEDGDGPILSEHEVEHVFGLGYRLVLD